MSDYIDGEAVARVQSYISDRPFSKGKRVKEVVFLKDVPDDSLLYISPHEDEEKDASLTDSQASAIYNAAHNKVVADGGYETYYEFNAKLVRTIIDLSKDKT